MTTAARVGDVRPSRAIERGRIDLIGTGFPVRRPGPPAVWIGEQRARVAYASPTRLSVLVPTGIVEGGRTAIRVDGVDSESAVEIAAPFATGLHQVDSPVFDSHGNLFVTFSGTRGEQVPVSIFRVRPDGTRETFSSAVVNPTSMAIGPDGHLYVSSRFEGAVYRLDNDGGAELFASDLGIACGLAFARDGTLYAGDRSGTIFKVDPQGRATSFASLSPSVAAFHLALRGDGTLFVTAPTLSSYDTLFEITPAGTVRVRPERFGRPQGMAFDAAGALLVVEALAGMSGVYRLGGAGPAELLLAGPGLVGVAFDPRSGLVVCTNETAYHLPPAAA
jgi:sugar lactone lactonase YvrE